MAAAPVMAFWIMPAAVAAALLAPFGLDGPVWRLAAAGVEAVLAIGASVAAQQGAVVTTPQWPVSALVAITLGGLWLCLQRAPWRLAGIVALPLAVPIIAAAPPPDIFVSREGVNAAIVTRDENGDPALAVFNPHKDKFDAGVWKEVAGLDKARAPSLSMGEAGACDGAGCVARVKGAVVAISADPMGLAEDCRRADLVIALYPVRGGAFGRCKAAIIDRIGAWKRGARAVWIGGNGEIDIRNAQEMRGARPWTNGGA